MSREAGVTHVHRPWRRESEERSALVVGGGGGGLKGTTLRKTKPNPVTMATETPALWEQVVCL